MAKRKAKRPKLFQNKQSIQTTMKQVGNVLVEKTLDAGMSAIKQSDTTDKRVTRKPKYLEVTEARLNKMGVFDLKPYFARSSHAKKTKKGGWYLTIPIPRRKKNMSRRMYDQLRSIDLGKANEKTVISNYLYDRRRSSEASMLNYEPKSNTINKRRTGARKHAYVAYRTVSNKSPVSSWIVNRDKVNSADTSKTFVRNVNRLMKWKMKNGWM
jgi:hypothetical protein